jgi:hypothetical protein
MFVRFRQIGARLQVSVVETHRADGRVRHEHVAGLGSIETSLRIADRITFWNRLHERLARLANRIDAEAHAKILGAVHAKVPMVTADEQRALQLDNAKADAEFWDRLQDMHACTTEDHKGLARQVGSRIAEGEAAAASAKAKAETARDRVARIERGEDVAGGLGKPMTYAQAVAIMLGAGLTKRDIEDAKLIAALPEDAIKVARDAAVKAMDRASMAAVRRYARRLGKL